MKLLGTEKKIIEPLGTKKNHSTSQDKKNHATSQDKKNHATSWNKKKIKQPFGTQKVLRIQILVTIKIQEIGTDHLGLVLFLHHHSEIAHFFGPRPTSKLFESP